jgi:hypothetical protein
MQEGTYGRTGAAVLHYFIASGAWRAFPGGAEMI